MKSTILRHLLALAACLGIYTLYIIILLLLEIPQGGGLMMIIPLLIMPWLYRRISRSKPLKQVRSELIEQARKAKEEQEKNVCK